MSRHALLYASSLVYVRAGDYIYPAATVSPQHSPAPSSPVVSHALLRGDRILCACVCVCVFRYGTAMPWSVFTAETDNECGQFTESLSLDYPACTLSFL